MTNALRIRRLLTMTATVTTIATGDEDPFGDAVAVAGSATTWPCWIGQVQRTEDTANTERTAEVWQAYFPAEAAGTITARDRVTVDGAEYELDGPPWDVTNPRTGTRTHVVATLRRVV